MSVMFCNKCGKQNPENSRFCSHCGHEVVQIKTSVKDENITKKIDHIIEQHDKKEHDKNNNLFIFLKKIMGWYLAWVALHLGILLIWSEAIFTDGSSTNDFWPFSYGRYNNGIGEYDIREFLVYTIFPLAFLIIWSLVTPIKSKVIKERKPSKVKPIKPIVIKERKLPKVEPIKPKVIKESKPPKVEPIEDEEEASSGDTKNFLSLKSSLKKDEIIIQMKGTEVLKVIKKSEHETNKELHLSSKYRVVLVESKPPKA